MSVIPTHRYTLEERMKRTDCAQLALKREADPNGPLHPGRMIVRDDPDVCFAALDTRGAA